MSEKMRFIQAIPIGSVFLKNDNPRFEPVKSEREAIEVLCTSENVYPLAADIAKNGLNPLERFALVPAGPKGKRQKNSYVVAEGNRRLCAIKLLNDPELAPSKLKKAFHDLAEEWEPVATIPAVVFRDEDDVRIWLHRIHYGEQGGVGRRRWNAEQQERFAGGGRNKLAQDFLDYAESEKLITPKQREGKLTTVQRFMSNEVFREALGLDNSDPNELKRTRPEEDFKSLSARFIRDLLQADEVNSRKNKPQILDYARKLGSDKTISAQRTPANPLKSPSKPSAKAATKTRPIPPARPQFIAHEIDVETALKALGIYKLENLYHSIVSLELDQHTPLLAVGVWSFFETLTACVGRNDKPDFLAFLSKERLASLGIKAGNDTKAVQAALKRLQEFGNNTKHHATAATFDGQQLHNDMEVVSDLIVKCAREAAKNKA